MMRFWSGVLAIFLVFAAVPGWTAEGWSVADAVVAKVDGQVVTLSDIKAERLFSSWSGSVGVPVRDGKELLAAVVRRKLLVRQAEKLRMEVPSAEVLGGVRELFSAGLGEEAFWERLASLGYGKGDCLQRFREVYLARNFMELRRRSTYVPENDVRAFYRENRTAFEGRSLSDVRDEVRELLADRKYSSELDSWIATQSKLGRVRVFDLPGDFRLE